MNINQILHSNSIIIFSCVYQTQLRRLKHATHFSWLNGTYINQCCWRDGSAVGSPNTIYILVCSYVTGFRSIILFWLFGKRHFIIIFLSFSEYFNNDKRANGQILVPFRWESYAWETTTMQRGGKKKEDLNNNFTTTMMKEITFGSSATERRVRERDSNKESVRWCLSLLFGWFLFDVNIIISPRIESPNHFVISNRKWTKRKKKIEMILMAKRFFFFFFHS